jgi:Holliday junction resolvasome RuvABC ATP-dependent DNA helicase subunit
MHKAFDNIVGQNRLRNMLSLSAEAGANGREMLSGLVRGVAGLGKTALSMAYMNAILEGIPDAKPLCYEPRDLRLAGEAYNDVINAITSPDPYILFLDEVHELATDNTKQCKTIFNFIRKALDGNRKDTQIHVADEQFAVFDRRKQVIIIATNYPHLLDKSGALQSRMTNISLDLYTEAELRKITLLMAGKNNITFNVTENENPVDRIARCGRGTARYLERIMEQLQLVNDGEPITEKQVLSALRNIKIYPRGLDDKEVLLLKVAAKNPINRQQFTAMSQMESEELKKSLAYLTHPDVRFITQLPSGFLETTKRGVAYMKKCEEMGFVI